MIYGGSNGDKWQCSIAMLNYQRVFVACFPLYLDLRMMLPKCPIFLESALIWNAAHPRLGGISYSVLRSELACVVSLYILLSNTRACIEVPCSELHIAATKKSLGGVSFKRRPEGILGKRQSTRLSRCACASRQPTGGSS